MGSKFKVIESTVEKLSSIDFLAGQYIIIAAGEKKYVYYDSLVSGKRELLKSEDIPQEIIINWIGDPTTITVGGLSAGSVVSGKTPSELLYDITHPFIAPSLYMNIVDANGVFEKKTTKSISTITLTSSGGSIGAFKNRTNPIALYNNDVVINSSKYTVVINDDNTATIVFTTPIALDGTVDTTIKATVVVNGNTLSVSKSFVFVNPIYHGISDNNSIDVAGILATGIKESKAKYSPSYIFTGANKCTYIAYDKSWGVLTSIVDQNNFNITNSYGRYEITIPSTGAVYYVYIAMIPSTVSNFTIKFNF